MTADACWNTQLTASSRIIGTVHENVQKLFPKINMIYNDLHERITQRTRGTINKLYL